MITVSLIGEIAGKNDRALLLQTQAHLERGIQWISLYKATFESVCDGSMDVSLMHSELLYALTRVRVKLASTILQSGSYHTHYSIVHVTLPLCVCVCVCMCVCVCVCVCVSATPEMTQKPSSLPKKVLERQKKVEQHQVLLSTLTAQDTPVKSLDQLRTECGRNHYHTALLAMLESVFTQSITHTKRVGLLKVVYSYCVFLIHSPRLLLLLCVCVCVCVCVVTAGSSVTARTTW